MKVPRHEMSEETQDLLNRVDALDEEIEKQLKSVYNFILEIEAML